MGAKSEVKRGMTLVNGQVAVITGAASGIGKALAVACASRGMKVLAADIDLVGAEQTAIELRAKNAVALAAQVDVASENSVEALADRCWEELGACHLLCNNAGVSARVAIADSASHDWKRTIGVNLLGITHAASAFIPRMLSQEHAHVLNTVSMAGVAPLPGFGPYVASKYAAIGASEVLALELENTSVGVSVLCPGMVSTNIQASETNPAPSEPPFDPRYSRILTAGKVAETSLTGIENGLFYIFSHPEWFALCEERMTRLRADLSLSRKIDGLPSAAP